LIGVGISLAVLRGDLLSALPASPRSAADGVRPTTPDPNVVERPSATDGIESHAARFSPIAMQTASDGGPGNSNPSNARDGFDIPWPTPGRNSVGDEIDWEKLDRIIREHNDLHEKWKMQRENYTKFTDHLMTVGTNLQNLQNRAESVGRTMSKIRGIIGDDNADNADVFAPPETPHWNQSLAKTYTLRAGEMGRLNAKAAHLVNDFNATLGRIDTNLANQKRTLSRAIELRGEWARITRPFSLWTKQDFPIPVETSTRWILDNETFAPAYVARSVAEIHQKNYAKAREDIHLALKRDPSWAELYGLLAVVEERAGKNADAEKSLKVVRRLKKRPAFLEVCEGIVAAEHNNFDMARLKFTAATKHDPTDPTAQVELALLYLAFPKSEKRDPAAAVEAATAACKTASWSQWWCLDVLGIAYAASGDFDRAAACARRAKEVAPGDRQQLLDERIATYKNKQVPSVAIGEI
jgi:tetratricopeptide (TPR) repeat protein